MITTLTLLTSCLKLILIPAYRSTDFEVHRNWLAITYSTPLKQWYFENTSNWTLDYPPFFAYFEYLLSLVGQFVDPNMLKLDNLNYASDQTIIFQRLSVIFTDLIYSYGVYKCCRAIDKNWRSDVVLPILLITNCGLIMIDHIHFQYNGILYGLLLISISYMLKENYPASAFWFAVLLNMKHIYMYMAPAYLIYMFQKYCLTKSLQSKRINLKIFIRNFSTLSTIVIFVFLLSFLPFYDQLGQVFSRLFPFKRGLSHAYWAPNIWAIYNIIDKILTIFYPSSTTMKASMTGGLVQEYSHVILPNITPIITLILTGIMMLPALIKLYFAKNRLNFIRCLVLCALTSFLFGWHVHEKAILMAIIPLSVLSILHNYDAKIFLLLQTVGHYSLFPLLYPQSLLFIKILLLIIYSLYAFHILSRIHSTVINKYSLPFLNIVETLYILGLSLLIFYENILHYCLKFDEKLPFLPLALTSVYCAIGIIYSWLCYYSYFLKLNS